MSSAATTADLSEHIERLDRDGFTIVHDAFTPLLAEQLSADIDRLEAVRKVKPADNDFEGRNTTRVYNLLAHSMGYEQIPVHPVVLPLVQHLLGDGCLVSSLSSITIGPGETAQPIHADDQVIPIAKPHAACTANSMWALTDFTEANGATRVVPGSHLADGSPEYRRHYDSVAAEMPAGSILVWHGSLWHGGGANTTAQRRRGIAMNYCAGWVRQQENQQLGVPKSRVKGFSPELQGLCGFGIYRGLIGHIDRKPPSAVVLGSKLRQAMLWDRT
jgi:ectoine hydroxylase-related dioxygenase (phytanoyl-CoA dioxygenase family)